MNYKTILFISILFLTISCGGGGGGSYSSNNSVSSASSTPALANLNSGNACKKAWYTTTFPDPTSTNAVFNNYTFFWQDTSFKDTKICYNRTYKDILRPGCDRAWSNPNGQDLAPVKDATVSVELALGLNNIYSLFFNDYKIDDESGCRRQR